MGDFCWKKVGDGQFTMTDSMERHQRGCGRSIDTLMDNLSRFDNFIDAIWIIAAVGYMISVAQGTPLSQLKKLSIAACIVRGGINVVKLPGALCKLATGKTCLEEHSQAERLQHNGKLIFTKRDNEKIAADLLVIIGRMALIVFALQRLDAIPKATYTKYINVTMCVTFSGATLLYTGNSVKAYRNEEDEEKKKQALIDLIINVMQVAALVFELGLLKASAPIQLHITAGAFALTATVAELINESSKQDDLYVTKLTGASLKEPSLLVN